MKIAHVTSHLSRRAAGVKVAVEATSKAQLELGNDVRVFGLEDSYWNEGDRECWDGAPTTACRTVGPIKFGYAPRLLPELAAFRPDVVHLHGLWMYPGYAVLSWHKKTKQPYVLSVHGMMWREARQFSPIKKKVVRILFQDRVFQHASCIHVTASSEAGEVRDFGLKNPIVQVGLGINVPDTSHIPHSNTQTKTVLTLGRIHPKKGIDRLLDAWALVEPDFADWQLRIVGPDEIGTKAKLIRQSNSLGLRRVSFDEPIQGDEKLRLMRDAEIFVLPTRNENFAFTVPESLAVETPVICTTGAPWKGLNEQQCGWWIEQGVEPLAQTLRDAMSLPASDRKDMGVRGREWMMSEYNWPTLAAELVECYETLS